MSTPVAAFDFINNPYFGFPGGGGGEPSPIDYLDSYGNLLLAEYLDALRKHEEGPPAEPVEPSGGQAQPPGEPAPPVDTAPTTESPTGPSLEGLSPEQRSIYEKLIGLGLGTAVAIELARNPTWTTDVMLPPDPPTNIEVNQPTAPPVPPGESPVSPVEDLPSPSPPPDVFIPPGGMPNFPIDVVDGLPNFPIDVLGGLPTLPIGPNLFPWIPKDIPPPRKELPPIGDPPWKELPPSIPELPGLPGLPGQQPQPQITNNKSLALGAGNFPELQYPGVPNLEPVGGQIYANPFPFQMIRR